MPRDRSRKRKARAGEAEAEDPEAVTDFSQLYRGVLESGTRLKTWIKALEDENARFRQGLIDPDVVVDMLKKRVHYAGDFNVIYRALQPKPRRPRGKVRTLVLHDQAAHLPDTMTKKEEKQEVRIRSTRKWTPRKSAGSAYTSAASDAGEESVGDSVEEEKTEA
ncbi:uncharacterized protein IUM83_04694 [Phytophthora cinnamomi]|uniref:uncharacterized protein n=1 Tax=Phytophthora cinnamomi TaxID=4785 RepID=UPI003559E592|nr:hypothetical protein IUM83_04694 [Phytophthora cinnamomi]